MFLAKKETYLTRPRETGAISLWWCAWLNSDWAIPICLYLTKSSFTCIKSQTLPSKIRFFLRKKKSCSFLGYEWTFCIWAQYERGPEIKHRLKDESTNQTICNIFTAIFGSSRALRSQNSRAAAIGWEKNDPFFKRTGTQASACPLQQQDLNTWQREGGLEGPPEISRFIPFFFHKERILEQLRAWMANEDSGKIL